MATVEHNVITDPEIHEPKGVAAAADGEVLSKVSGVSAWVQPSTLVGLQSLPIFVQTQDVIVQNTLTETTLIGVGEGSLILAANTIKVGGFIEATIQGVISRTANPTLRFRAKASGFTILDTGFKVISGITNGHWVARISAITRAIGTTGKIMLAGSFVTSGGDHFEMVRIGTSPDEVTLDTTVAIALDFTVEWGTADAANIINAQLARVERG